MSSYNCIIVDDELIAREGIFLLLQSASDIKIVGMTGDGLEAIDLINQLKPDILFLDIQMPEIDGFDILRSINQLPPAIIFITAHSEHAIKAFEVHALDYLLKPVRESRFQETLQRVREKFKDPNDHTENLRKLLSAEATRSGSAIFNDNNKIVIKADGKIHVLKPESIFWVEAYDYYSKIHTDDQFLLVRSPLKSIEESLPENFIRVHRSAVVNIQRIKTIDHAGTRDSVVKLENGESIKVSRTYYKSLMERFT